MSISVQLFRQVAACLLLAVMCVGCGGESRQAALTATPMPTPVPTLPPTNDVKEIVRRWKAAVENINTLRVSQSFMLLKKDGSRVSIPNDWGGPRTTDKVYEFIPDVHGRYKVWSICARVILCHSMMESIRTAIEVGLKRSINQCTTRYTSLGNIGMMTIGNG